MSPVQRVLRKTRVVLKYRDRAGMHTSVLCGLVLDVPAVSKYFIFVYPVVHNESYGLRDVISGTRDSSWLGHCATSRKVAGSILWGSLKFVIVLIPFCVFNVCSTCTLLCL